MSSELPTWLKAGGDGVTLSLALQPGAKTTAIVGIHDGALKIRVASPPVDGAANAALLAFLVATLKCKSRQVELLHGATGRRKVVKVTGIGVAEVSATLGGKLPARSGP